MDNFLPNTSRAFSVDSKTTVKNPCMKRLASQLAVIHISLDPPSPPPLEPNYTNSKLSVDYSKDNYISSFTWQYDYGHRIDDSRLLQVPGSSDLLDDGIPRQCSPPPRRFSYASTTSENSSTSPNASYQNLLSPFIYSIDSMMDRQTSHSVGSDDSETPPPIIGYRHGRSASNRSFDTIGSITPNNQVRSLSALVCFF